MAKPYSELEVLHMLVDDLLMDKDNWEQDRMTSIGVEGLNKLANHVNQIQSLIMHDEYYKKYQEK